MSTSFLGVMTVTQFCDDGYSSQPDMQDERYSDRDERNSV